MKHFELLYFFQVRLQDKYQDENQLLHVMMSAELNTLVANNGFKNRIEYIKSIFPNKQLTLLIFGLKEFCRFNKENVGRMAFETALTEIQIMEGVCHRLLDTAEDIAQAFLQFSKSIAEKPYKYRTSVCFFWPYFRRYNAFDFLKFQKRS